MVQKILFITRMGQELGKYIIFDRDGTLIKEIPYLNDFRKVKLMDKVIEGVLIFKEKSFRFGIITNQSAIGRGLASFSEIELINKQITDAFGIYGIFFDFIMMCPHSPIDMCKCRKPNPALGEKAIREFDIDIPHSIMIGDKDLDIQFGSKIGFKTARILGKYTVSEKADFTGSDMLSIAKSI